MHVNERIISGLNLGGNPSGQRHQNEVLQPVPVQFLCTALCCHSSARLSGSVPLYDMLGICSAKGGLATGCIPSEGPIPHFQCLLHTHKYIIKSI